MTRIMKSALLAGAAFSAISGAAHAQDATPQDAASTVEDIVVTARRTEESAQRTPLALTAFSGQTLERVGAQQVTDLQGAVPNLNIVQGRGSSNSTNIYIRGVGQPDALQTFDPAVGVYVDDVYFSRIRGTQFDLLDLERVEDQFAGVGRGPRRGLGRSAPPGGCGGIPGRGDVWLAHRLRLVAQGRPVQRRHSYSKKRRYALEDRSSLQALRFDTAVKRGQFRENH
ncbi:hypothetical protein BH10PSE1_BH10PSE1_22910 [soil metagenome]